MLIGTAVCGKPHVRWCERAGEIKPSPLYSIGGEDDHEDLISLGYRALHKRKQDDDVCDYTQNKNGQSKEEI